MKIKVFHFSNVAPHAGAWIEMVLPIHQRSAIIIFAADIIRCHVTYDNLVDISGSKLLYEVRILKRSVPRIRRPYTKMPCFTT